MSRLILIEDDVAISTVIATRFATAGFDVDCVDTGAAGIDLLSQSPSDLAIIDLRLPDMSGIDVVRSVRQETDIPLVILTAYSNTTEVIEALRAGADDFLAKPINLEELLARVSAMLRRYGERATDGRAAEIAVGTVSINTETGEAYVNQHRVILTRTEFRVLYELLQAGNLLVSKAHLLDRVWGYDYLGETRLVDTQIYRLRAKLAAAGAEDCITTVRGRGYRLSSEV